MNRALFELIGINHKSLLRRTLRGVKTWRGAFLLLFTLGFFALMIGPQIFAAVMMRGRPEIRQMTEALEPLAPLGLMAFTLLFAFTSAGEAAIYFTPAEVDFLFAAPFSRRELLLYKLARTGIALVFFSALLTLMMLGTLRWWVSGFLGIMLSLGMVQLVGMATAMAGQIAAETAYTRTRRAVLMLVAMVALFGIAQAAGQVQARGLVGLMDVLRQSAAFRALLAPFRVFTEILFVEEWYPGLAGWGAAALAIDAALLVLVLRLDADYLETAAAVSQKIYERIQRTRQGGGIAMPMGTRAGRIRLPELPWLAGAGPVAWRQVLIVLRTSRYLLMGAAVVAAMVVAGGWYMTGPGGGALGSSQVIGFGLGWTCYMTFLFGMQLPWAFRGDLDHIEFLKTLPLRPALLAAGELSGGILMLTAVQLVLFGVVAAAAPSGWPTMLTASAFCLPFNAVMLGVNNLLFLIYPVRHPAGTAFDFQMFGKMMLFFLLQFAALVPMLGLPAAFGGAAYLLAGYSWPAFVATTWMLLAAELVPIVVAVAWAFDRFDVGTQTPA